MTVNRIEWDVRIKLPKHEQTEYAKALNEYYQANKEKKSEYRQANKEKTNKRVRDVRNNPELVKARLERFTCECGTKICAATKTSHINGAKHWMGRTTGTNLRI